MDFNHLCFVDDQMLFVAADETAILAVQRVLLQSKHIFGLVVNQAKSEVFFFFSLVVFDVTK